MPRQKDPAWASHTVVIEKEENKAGIAVTVKGWKCRYCKKYFWNHALMRLFEHLTFDSAMCTSGIDPCSRLQVEDSVIDAARSACLDKAIAKSSEKKRVAESDEVEAAGDRERAEKVQSKLHNTTVEVCEVNGALADFFDGLGIAHAKVCVAPVKIVISHSARLLGRRKGPADTAIHAKILG